MLAGSLQIQIEAEMSKFVVDLEKAKRLTGQSMSDMSASMDKVTATLAAMAAAERARAGVFANTWAETKRLLGIAKIGADEIAKALAGLEVPAEAIASLNTWSERAAYAIGAGAAKGWDKAKTYWEDFKGWLEKQIVIWGIALAVGISAAVLGAVYAAFQAISFAVGLLTGESYKSANIDALKAMNSEVKTLQENLPLTAVGASALNEALKGLGTSASGYVETLGRVESASRSNVEELDRLGVKYKDQNGNLFTTRERLLSAAAVLATYTEGWDRHQAEIAIGMGSEKQIQDALAVTAEKTQIAKERLIDFGLIIGPGTQEAVAQYEEAMRAFERESELTSKGFKKAIADNVMPILTDLATFFRDGFPRAVSLFRDSMAIITSAFYGLKTIVFVVAESILGSLQSIGIGIGALAAASVMAMKGDFTGAKDRLVQGWADAQARLGGIGDNISAQLINNAKAVNLAWGEDNLGANAAADAVTKAGKAWEAAPPKIKEEIKALVDNESAYRNLLKSLKEKLLLDTELTEAAKLQLAIDALSAKQREVITPEREKELKDLAALIDLRKKEKVILDSYLKYFEGLEIIKKEIAVDDAAKKKVIGDAIIATSKQIDQMELETSLIGKTNVEREIAIFLRQAEIDKIDGATIARGKEAIAAKHAAQEENRMQVDMWKSVESAGHQAFLSIFDTSKNVLERIRDMLKTHLIDILYQMTIKKWIFNIVASVSGAGVAQSAIGSTGAASSMGGIGSLFSGLGSFASGISSVAGGADWSSITGAAAGATGIVDSVFQTMGVKLGSQFLADIGNFNWGVPVLSGVIMALSGNVSGGIGSTIGGIAGSYFGPVGTAVGSFLGGMLGSALGGGGHSTAGTGYRIAGGASQAAFSGSFIGLSASDEAQYQDLLSDQAGWTRYLNTRLAAVAAGMDQLAARLGAPVGALSGKTFNVDVTGPLDMPQVVQMALASVAQQMAEELVPNLRDYRQENEALDATLNRLIGDLDAVRIVFDTLGKTTGLTVETSERLVAVFGGLNNLQSQFQAYYTAFYSDAERTALTTKQLTESFHNLGIAEPQTRAQFRALVGSLDLTTAAGALTFKELLDIAPAFDQVAKAAEAAGAAVLSLAEQISAAQTSALTAIEAQIRASQSAADTARTAAESYRQITTSLADAVTQLRGGALSTLTPGQKLAEARSQLDTVYGQAATGDATALAKLPETATAFLEASRAYNASSSAYTTDFDMVMRLLGQAGLASTAMTNVQDYQATLLQTQTGVLEAIQAQLELPSPDLEILAQQTDLLATIAGLLQAQTTQIVSGNGMQAVLIQDQTGRIILSNAIATDQTGQIVLGNSLLTAASAMAQLQAGQMLAGTYLVRDGVGNLLNVSVDQSGRISDVGALIGAGIDIRSAAVIGSYLDAVSASFTGNNTAEASAVRSAIAVLRQTTADGLIAAAEALPTRSALAVLQSSTGALLAQSIVVDSAAALNAVERATAIIQATTSLQSAIGAQTGTLLAGTYSVIDPRTGQLVGLTVDQTGQITAGNSLLAAANAAQGIIQSLLNGQTVEIVGGNLIQRDQAGLIIASNSLLRDQTGALRLGNTLVGTQTQQIVTGNATQDAIRNIGALNTSYSEQMLTALVSGAMTQSDSLQGILGASDLTVSLLRQLVGLMGQSQTEAAAAIAAEQAAAAIAAEQAAAAIRAAQASASQAAAAAEAEKVVSAAVASSPVAPAAGMTNDELMAKYGLFLSGTGLRRIDDPDTLVASFDMLDEYLRALPGHASGLSYVPRDDYLFRAHQGEAVLTAPQAANWRSGGASITSADLDALRQEFKDLRTEARATPLTIEESGRDTVAALKRGLADMSSKLEALGTELRRLTA